VRFRAIDPEYNIITVEPLTERELEVLQLIVDGYSNITIAGALYITVSNRRKQFCYFIEGSSMTHLLVQSKMILSMKVTSD